MEKGKLWPPPPPLNPLNHSAKFDPDRIRGFVSAHARLRTPNCLLGYFFLGGGCVQEITYSQDAPTNFDAKYTAKDAVPGKDVSFRDHRTKIKHLHPFLSKNANFRPDFVLRNFQPKNSFNIGGAKSKRPLNVIHRSCDTAHAQWLQTHCRWYRMGDVRTHNSRTDSRRTFKLGQGIDHVTRHVWLLIKIKRPKVKFTRLHNVSAAITLYLGNGWSYQVHTSWKLSSW